MTEIMDRALKGVKEGDQINEHMIHSNHTDRTFSQYVKDLGLDIPAMIGERLLEEEG